MTIGKDVLLVVDSVSNEKGVDKGVIFEAIESALASVTAKRYGEEVTIRVDINQENGDYETFRCWQVIDDNEEEIEFPGKVIKLSDAKKLDESLNVGDIVEESVESAGFGRIAAQQAKQVIVQKVREAEREKIIDRYRDRLNSLVIGVAKRVTRDSIILDLGDGAEAIIMREEMIPREAFRMGDRIRGYLHGVRPEAKGPQLLVSRTHPGMLVELFKIEVPEVSEEVIEIKAAARDPGSRAKIAVKTNDGRIDPIGACVGMRGSRVQAVSSELNGERIDIVLWDANPAQLVINAMAPAEVLSIVADEESHTMDIAVSEEQLSQAIGRGGQNVRLASELTGWTLNVMTESGVEEKAAGASEKYKQLFIKELDVDEDIASVLAREGFTGLEEVAYVSEQEMLEVEEFDADMVKALRARARDVLLEKELSGEGAPKPAEDLLALEGMTEVIANELASHGIITREDLAEQAVDDLDEVKSLNDELAAKLIMEARAPWFKEGEE